MLENIPLSKTIYLDIETVPGQKSLADLPPYVQELWEEKRGRLREEGVEPADFYFNSAGILAEFGKIICISIGYFAEMDGKRIFKLKSLYGHDEVLILKDLVKILKKFDDAFKGKMMLCGHNIKEFDVPYICRRLLMHGMIDEFPEFFSKMQTAKPWEMQNYILDTMDTWRFGDYKNYISLKLLAFALGIPSPKEDISGKDVAKVYYEEDGLERIRKYCQRDVATLAQIVLRLKGMPQLNDDEIIEI
jgi:hypothetical protein